MIPASELAAVFYEIIGWPYKTPGSNDSRGIDCSGAFVYAYRRFDQRIYHGSNRIIREYCNGVFDVRDRSELRVGMAIFKSRTNVSNMKDEYKPGGRYYDPALPNDYYHMGLVCSVEPLEIVNATPPRARIDTDLRGWCCAGYLNAVDYGEEPGDGGYEECVRNCEQLGREAVVTAASGSTVNLRREPSRSATVLVRVPLGARVTLLDGAGGEWRRVRYESVTGYMMSEFLIPK